MAWSMKAQCDVCGKYKEEVNHWFIVFGDQSVNRFTRDQGVVAASGIFVAPWDDLLAEDPKGKHCCSQNCAMKLVQRLMDVQKGAA